MARTHDAVDGELADRDDGPQPPVIRFAEAAGCAGIQPRVIVGMGVRAVLHRGWCRVSVLGQVRAVVGDRRDQRDQKSHAERQAKQPPCEAEHDPEHDNRDQ